MGAGKTADPRIHSPANGRRQGPLLSAGFCRGIPVWCRECDRRRLWRERKPIELQQTSRDVELRAIDRISFSISMSKTIYRAVARHMWCSGTLMRSSVYRYPKEPDKKRRVRGVHEFGPKGSGRKKPAKRAVWYLPGRMLGRDSFRFHRQHCRSLRRFPI